MTYAITFILGGALGFFFACLMLSGSPPTPRITTGCIIYDLPEIPRPVMSLDPRDN